jgi:hypothetical protein
VKPGCSFSLSALDEINFELSDFRPGIGNPGRDSEQYEQGIIASNNVESYPENVRLNMMRLPAVARFHGVITAAEIIRCR